MDLLVIRHAIAVDPAHSSNVYVATEVGGLWGTKNGGSTWTRLFNPFEDMAFSSVKVHPSVPGLVAAGLIAHGGGYFRSLNQHTGVVLSKDGGTTWKNIGPSSDPTATVWEIGFGDATVQRHHFGRQVGTSPVRYRRAFRTHR